MKYIINGRFLTQRITGVQRYAREIVSELDKLCVNKNIEIAIPENVDDIPHYENIKIVRIGKTNGVKWEQTAFSRYVKKEKGVSVNLCNSAPLTGKKIVTIHDVKVKAHPEFFGWKFRLWYNFLFRNIVKKAQVIITVSEFSKSEIIRYYRCDPNKVHVIYNGWQHYEQIPVEEDVLGKFLLSEGQYIFALGSLDPNKNLKWILETAKNNPQEKFIVGGGINKKVFAEQEFILPKNVQLVGYLSDVESKSLMHYCKAFVFPSFYEGFGIPPMEAMVAGARNIIVSDIPVMHEIFGESVSYISPTEYTYAIEDILAEREKDNKEEQSQKILEKYSWKMSAQKLYEILR